MNCEKCGVAVARESAVAGMWCWRCGEKEEERLGKMIDELPTITSDAPAPLISNEPPPMAVDMTYEEVKKEWEAEAGRPLPGLFKKKGHR